MPIYDVTVDGHRMSIRIDPGGRMTVDGEPVSVDIRQVADNRFSLLMGRESLTLLIEKRDGTYGVISGGSFHEVSVLSERDRMLRDFSRGSAASTSRLEIHAPMPALIVRVEVSVGDRVEQGTGLLVLEAMKMENELKAHQRARVKEIFATAGKPVEKGELLMLLEEDRETTGTE